MDSADREPQLLLINHQKAVSLPVPVSVLPEGGIPAGETIGPQFNL